MDGFHKFLPTLVSILVLGLRCLMLPRKRCVPITFKVDVHKLEIVN